MSTLVAVVLAIIGSGGFWTFLQYQVEKHSDTRRMLLGLGYERLISKCEEYIEQGHIPLNEYEELNKYLYEPYIAMGGNGTAKAMMEKVKNLPNK